MFFDSLHVSNFGPFPDLKCRFSPDGINLISGPNDSGKTQLVGALLFALWGIECVRQDGSAESASRVELIIREGDVSQTLVREVVSRTSLTEGFRTTTQSDLGLVNRPFHEVLVQSLKVTGAPSLVLRWPRSISPPEIKALMRAAAEKSLRGTSTEERELWVSVETVASSVSRIPKVSMLSIGEGFSLELAAEALRRQKAIDSIPLILDNPFSVFLDGDALQRACRLLIEIGRRSQVLLLTSRCAELAGMLGDNAVVHDWLEQPRPRHFSQISYRNGFLQQYGVAGDDRKKRGVSAPVPLVATEGKTDWKHLKAALAKLKASGMFENLEVTFWEYGNDPPMGSGELLGHCTKSARMPQLRPIIWVFDRDEPAIVRQVCGHDGKPKSWGNKVFSFAIPVPDHRSDFPDICLEFYYRDEDIKRTDLDARRLFLSNEFSSITGRHKTNKSLICSDTRRLQRLTIVDDCVFDEEERNVALPKNAFAENIVSEKAGFQNMDVSAFSGIFETIVAILRDVEDEESAFEAE